MRTTLSIADDVLLAAKAIAKTQRKTVGDVVSDRHVNLSRSRVRALESRNGIPLLPRRDCNAVVSIEIITVSTSPQSKRISMRR